MKQYEICPKLFYDNIQKALKNFEPEHLFIRKVGSMGGKIIINKNLKIKKMDIEKTKDGLWIIIDDKKIFFWELAETIKTIKGWPKIQKFAIAYFKRGQIPLSTGIDPNDKTLPLVEESVLRAANKYYFLEITFNGKIPLKICALKNEERDWDLWEISI